MQKITPRPTQMSSDPFSFPTKQEVSVDFPSFSTYLFAKNED